MKNEKDIEERLQEWKKGVEEKEIERDKLKERLEGLAGSVMQQVNVDKMNGWYALMECKMDDMKGLSEYCVGVNMYKQVAIIQNQIKVYKD